ncbi:MAG TPA: hypothetical protein VGK47_03345 [Nitrososphaeraceae archaeon]
MVEPSSIITLIPTDPIQLGLTIDIAGGIVVGTYEGVRQSSNMKHQLYLDVAKDKLEKIRKASNDYIKLASCAKHIHEQLRSPDRNDQYCFYLVCKFFFFYSNIIHNFAGFELDDLDGEEVISLLVGSIFYEIQKESSINYIPQLIDLVFIDSNELTLTKFFNNINNSEREEFKKFLDRNRSILIR